jgi:hypothetical protein
MTDLRPNGEEHPHAALAGPSTEPAPQPSLTCPRCNAILNPASLAWYLCPSCGKCWEDRPVPVHIHQLPAYAPC